MIVAGFGFRTGTAVSSLQAALALAQKGHPSATLLATAQDKAGGLLPLAEALSLLVAGVTPEALATMTTHTRSAVSLAARGIGSVAEASALAAAGPGARLLQQRLISPDRKATCALAQGSST